EHDVEATTVAARVAPPVGAGGVDRPVTDVLPRLVRRGEWADACRLRGCEHGETDALLDGRGEDLVVDGRLREPHAGGGPPDAVVEVGQPPAHLGAQVPFIA